MIEWSKGLKTGAISGVIYGAVNSLAMTIISSLRWDSNISFYVFFSAIWGLIPGLIIGLIIGAVFAFVYRILPGTTSLVKGITISILFWFLFSFLFQFIIFKYGSYFSDNAQREIIASLILYIFFGFLLGFFWDRFSRLEKKCQKCKRVVPKDANLCPYCGETIEQEEKRSTSN
jgi:hypothetical protein